MTSGVVFTERDGRALRSVALQFFINGALFASFIPRLPEIRDRVGITVGQVGLLLSAAAVFGLGGTIATGPLVERFGTRRTMLVSSAVVSTGLVVVGLATTWPVLLLGAGLMMCFDVLVDVPMNMQGSWLSARRHAPVMNRLHGLWSLGTLVGGFASSRLAAAGVDITTHLLASAAILLLALAYVGPGLLPVDETHSDENTADLAAAEGSGQVRRVLGGAMLTFAVAGFLALTFEAVTYDWAAFRLSDDLGATAGVAALGYVAATTGTTTGRLLGDSVASRLGPWRLSQVALALTGGGLLIAALVPSVPVVLFGYLVGGLGIATIFPVLYDRAARHRGRPAAALGALSTGIRVAVLVVPLLVGSLAQRSSVGTAIAIITVPAVIAFGLLNVRLRRATVVGPATS